MGDTYNCMEILVSDIEKIFSLWDIDQLFLILLCTMIIKNTIVFGPKNEKNCGLIIVLTQRNQWCDYTEEITNITIVKPNNNSESSASLNQSRFPFRIFDISLPQDQTRCVYFLCHKYMPLMYTLYQIYF